MEYTNMVHIADDFTLRVEDWMLVDTPCDIIIDVHQRDSTWSEREEVPENEH
jgi:hypothetical protein